MCYLSYNANSSSISFATFSEWTNIFGITYPSGYVEKHASFSIPDGKSSPVTFPFEGLSSISVLRFSKAFNISGSSKGWSLGLD